MFDWLFDFIQNLIWNGVYAIVGMTNEMWSGVYSLTSTKSLTTILDLEVIRQVVVATTTLGGVLIALVFAVTMIKNIIELDGQQNTIVYRRTLFAVIWMFMSVAVFQYSVPIVGYLTQAAVSISGTPSEGTLDFSTNIASSLLAQSTSNPTKYQPEIHKQIQDGSFDASIRCEDSKGICPSGTDEKAYVFSLGKMLVIGLLTFIVSFLTLIVGVQVARRLLETVVLKTLAPLCASSWISDAQAQRARTWQKMSVGVLLATAGQLFAISIGVVVLSQLNTVIDGTGGAFVYGYVLLVIGIMLFIIFTPNTINTLVDGQTSISEGLQELVALGSASSAASNLGGMATGVGGAIGGAMGGMAAMGGNTLSKMATGQSLSALSANAQKAFGSGGGSGLGGSSTGTPSSNSLTGGAVGEATTGYTTNPTSGTQTTNASTPPLSSATGMIPNMVNTASAMTNSFVQSGGGMNGFVSATRTGASAIGGATTGAFKSVANRVGERTGLNKVSNTVKFGSMLAYAQMASNGIGSANAPKSGGTGV